eukprot:GEMP01121483.1.p1 GENE.GEMP01121483.1~~GEMP01121483.1.p1  ORF type:complete len:123 (+),score=22.92 GEMP01121483.1:48-416(+)
MRVSIAFLIVLTFGVDNPLSICKNGCTCDNNDCGCNIGFCQGEDMACAACPCMTDPETPEHSVDFSCIGTESGQSCGFECESGYRPAGRVWCISGRWEEHGACVEDDAEDASVPPENPREEL